jgi:hypothetical protein
VRRRGIRTTERSQEVWHATTRSDISPERRGGLRSGKPGPRGRTRDQLYEEARRLSVEGRSKMNKAQLLDAVENKER